MRAITVSPGIAHSARLEDIPDPPESDGPVLVRTLALGVCGIFGRLARHAPGIVEENVDRFQEDIVRRPCFAAEITAQCRRTHP